MSKRARLAVFAAAFLTAMFFGAGDSRKIGLVVRALFVIAMMALMTWVALPSAVAFLKKQVAGIVAMDRARQYRAIRLAVGVLVATHLIGIPIAHYQNRSIPANQLATGMTYSREMFRKCEVHTLVVDLGQVEPVVMKARDMAKGKRCLSEMSQSNGVTAAVNGDFYGAKGAQGFLLSFGRRYTAPRKDRPALAFFDNGTRANIATYQFTSDARVEIKNPDKPMNKPDKYRLRWSYNADDYTPGDIGVYTKQAEGAGCAENVIQARVELGGCSEGDTDLTGTISEVVYNPAVNLKPGYDEIILVAANEGNVSLNRSVYGWANRNFSIGKVVTAHLHVTPQPPSMLISGGPQLLQYGEYIVQEEGNGHLCRRTARTAIGVSSDGRYLLVIVAEGPTKWFAVRPKETVLRLVRGDFLGFAGAIWGDIETFTRSCIFNGLMSKVLGITRISSGMTLQDIDDFMKKRGEESNVTVSSAINLDGGNCAEMVVAKNGDLRIVNSPMEGSEERIATGLGFKTR